MKAINLLTLFLLIVGGVNWLLVGLFQLDLVAAILGGQGTMLSRLVYVLIGLAALWQLYPFVRTTQRGEEHAERHG